RGSRSLRRSSGVDPLGPSRPMRREPARPARAGMAWRVPHPTAADGRPCKGATARSTLRAMKNIACVLLLLLTAARFVQAAPPAADPDKKEWIALFDGKSLEGWVPKINGYDVGVNFGDTFRVENGVIRVSYDKYDEPFRSRFGHLFYKKPFSHYIVAVEYRFVGDQMKGGPEWAFR